MSARRPAPRPLTLTLPCRRRGEGAKQARVCESSPLARPRRGEVGVRGRGNLAAARRRPGKRLGVRYNAGSGGSQMTIRGVGSVFVLLALSAMGLVAQSSAPASVRYLTPPQPIVDILEAPPIPLAAVSPTRDTIALAERRSMPPIAELA